MKRIVLLIAFVTALSLCAGAQTLIDFNKMPMATNPTLMPDNYPQGMGLFWDNFYYVTPGAWSEEGLGFVVEPNTKDVIFAGGPVCALKIACTAMLKMNPIMNPSLTAVMKNQTFTPLHVTLSAGWEDNYVTVTGYNDGAYVGTLRLKATTTPRTFTFPTVWRVTQLAFTPDWLGNNAVIPDGSVVIYSISLMTNK